MKKVLFLFIACMAITSISMASTPIGATQEEVSSTPPKKGSKKGYNYKGHAKRNAKAKKTVQSRSKRAKGDLTRYSCKKG
jgi:hypothetical protein